MTNMRKATTTVGAALVLAAAGMAVSNATSYAEPQGHQVKYTLTSGAPYDFDLYYLATQPPNKAAYDKDPYTYLQKASVNVGPDAPWVFETTLADPQWAIFTVASTTHGGRAEPNAHCEIAVDGQVAVQNDHPYSPRCQLGQW
ncbi:MULTISPECIES: hypothetical protein [unclassified Mycolicibacterium]|uniref:hypothetical protein n=1 Tax=unclassified Mycolicibacterium TaxID=2636767 RepID=UPI0012DD6691|nr:MULTISPECIES: hypothetical protein [unclassified Mycolicibacterium]MUL84363.1 hypothetical protein [Mycolicibacterium sp. CBMA 329]MUL88138.1 hypothetical protein [Mycolicibacterium sp. CBMA 331]MUM02473.1 hypothetical protein [Mycolicibacterium sp. CBMA 334]MUM26015.1 hypothetical protein [Mycolicibacterium sp. CBMA 295]MUM39785.1 hypothetical protein [Mycolicibacterium sp. CBMA 247]